MVIALSPVQLLLFNCPVKLQHCYPKYIMVVSYDLEKKI